MDHLIEGLRRYLYLHPALALVCFTSGTLICIAMLSRAAETVATFWRRSNTGSATPLLPVVVLAERAEGAAMALRRLVHEAHRRAPASSSSQILELVERRQAATTWLLTRYTERFREEVAILRLEFKRHGLDDPGLEAYWSEPSSGEEVTRVAHALERLAWAPRAIP